MRLEFAGLRSYRQATVVDFSELDLFAIIGDTGAGKSTIIEALSLALYGRKTWTGGANLDELIAHGENTMAIELVFLADGNSWVVTRTRHRNSTAPVNKLECASTGEKLDGNKPVNDRIEGLLGLDHGQFVRAVVLPQGRFDELLQSTRTERNKILRSIFGLDDLRRVRDEALRRRDRWQSVVLAAEARRAALPPDPREVLADAQRTATDMLARGEQLTAAVAELADHETKRATLGEHQQRLSVMAASIDLPDSSVAVLAGLVDRAERVISERDQLIAEQRDAKQAHAANAAARAELLAGFADSAAAAGAASVLRSVRANLVELELEAIEVAAERDRLAHAVPDEHEPPELVARYQSATDDHRAAAESLASAQDRAQHAAELWRAYCDAADALVAARKRYAEADRAASDAGAAHQTADAALLIARSGLAEAKAAHSDAVRSNAVAVVSRGLEVGDPCPVCAQAIPVGLPAVEAGDLDMAEARVLAAERTLAAAQLEATTAGTASTRRADELRAVTVEVEAAEGALTTSQAAARSVALDVAAPTLDAALAAGRSEVTSAEKTLAEALSAVEVARSNRERARAEREAARAAHLAELAHAEKAAAAIEARRVSQRSQLADLPGEWAPPTDASADDLAVMARRVDDLLASVAAIEEQSGAADRALGRVQQRLGELRAEAIEQVTGPASVVSKTINERVHAAIALEELLIGLQAMSVEFATSMRVVPPLPASVRLDEVAALGSAAGAIVERLTPLACRAAETSVRLAAEQADIASGVREVLAKVDAADAHELASEQGWARAEAQRAAADVEVLVGHVSAAEDLDAVISVGRPYLARLELLALTLRDQHFVNHLVAAREVELLAEASRRLGAISDGRYGFVPDFGVVRIATGEVRSPDTLSGGERFQAALALALALVEIASRGAGRLDAVFVDEGFGSLDAAALDVALDTLGSVAGGGKLVALISHLRPVAEYVDTVFNVTKDDLSGSVIAKLDAEARERLLADDIRSRLTG